MRIKTTKIIEGVYEAVDGRFRLVRQGPEWSVTDTERAGEGPQAVQRKTDGVNWINRRLIQEREKTIGLEVRIEGSVHFTPTNLAAFVEVNEADVDIVRQVRALKPLEEVQLGGGAAPGFLVRRIRQSYLDAHLDEEELLVAKPPAAPSRQCSSCIHFRDELEEPEIVEPEDVNPPTDRGVHACLAFPKGIPAAILEERFNHRKPFKGDQGIRFEPINDAALAVVVEIFGGRTL